MLSGQLVGWAAAVLTVLLSSRAERPGDIFNAITKNDAAAVQAAIDADPGCIREVSPNRETPLHTAAHRGQAAIVELLITRGADVNAIAYNGFTPLHLTENADIARALVKAGANLSLRDSWGKTPLQSAVQGQRQAVVDALIEAGAKLDLVSALTLQKRDLAKRIIAEDPAAAKGEAGIDLWGNTTPLGIAAGQGDKEIVQLLLDAGAGVSVGTNMPNAGGDATPLCNAIWGGHAEIVELLLDKGADTTGAGGKFYDSIFDYAVQHSEARIVEALLKHGALNANGFYGFAMRKSPLSIAARNGDAVKVNLLLKYGAEYFNTEDKRRALFAAALMKQGEVVRVLRGAGVPSDIVIHAMLGESQEVTRTIDGQPELLNVTDPIFKRPLVSWAIAAGQRDLAIALIDRGADVKTIIARPVTDGALWEGTERPGFNGVGGYGQASESPLLVVMANDDAQLKPIDEELIHRLLEKGADPNVAGWIGARPLSLAIGAGNVKVVADLLAHGADPKAANEQGGTPLHGASGSKEIAALLLERGADPNAKGYGGMTPLDMALRVPETGVAEVLIAKGAVLSLYSACILDNADFVKEAIAKEPEALENSCIPDTNGMTPLVIASEHGSLKVMDVLLSAGAKTSGDWNWNGPLHSAAGAGKIDALKLLLERGADVHANSYQGTALHRAAMFGQLEAVKFLVDRGARVNQQADNGGWTPLHAVAYRDSGEVAEFLISKGAEVNSARPDCGRTPLHEADSSPNVVRVLLAHGADPSIRDSRGMTALDWARRENRDDDADEKAKRKQVVELLGAAHSK